MLLGDDVFASLQQLETRRSAAATIVDSDPGLPERLSGYHSRYWWMDPGAIWSLSKAGIEPTDPTAMAAATAAAHVEVNQGLAFQPIGSKVTKPSAQPDATDVFAKIDRLQQGPAPTPIGPTAPAAYSQAAGGLGMGSTIGTPPPPLERLISPTEWVKIAPNLRDELAQVSIAPVSDADMASIRAAHEQQAKELSSGMNPQASSGIYRGTLEGFSADTYFTVSGAANLSPEARAALNDKVFGRWGGSVKDFPGASGPVLEVNPRQTPEARAAVAEELNGAPANAFQVGALAASTVLSAPLQEVQGQIRNLHELIVKKDNPNWLQSQSDLGVAVGDVLGGRPVDLGSGVFAGGTVHDELLRRQTQRGLINGHGITAGRWLADALPDSFGGYHVMEPGSGAYNVLSGTVDASVAVFGDPTVWALKGFAASREAAKLFTEAGSVTKAVQTFRETGEVLPALQAFHDAGGISGLRGMTSQAAVDKWRTAPEQRPFLQVLADTGPNDSYKIWRAFQRQISPDVAAALADASDPAHVSDILASQLGSVVREKPSLARFVTGSSPLSLGASAPGEPLQLVDVGLPSRWVSMMPDEHVPSGSAAANAVQLERASTLMKVPDATFADLFDQMARATTPIERRKVWEQAADATAERLVGKGIGYERAKQLTRLNQADEAVGRVYATQEIGAGRGSLSNQLVVAGEPVFVADNQPTFLAQTLNQDIHLPDFRALRRSLSRFQGILDNPKVMGLENGWASVQGVWKKAQISTVKTMFKVLGDEQFSIAGRGYDSLASAHPISALSMILATPLSELPEDAGFLNRLALATEGKVQWSKLPGAVVGGGIESSKQAAKSGLRTIVEHVPGVDAAGTVRASYSPEGAAIPFDQMTEMHTILGSGLDTLNPDRLGILRAPDWSILPRQIGENDARFLEAHGRHFAQYAASPDTRGFVRAATLQEAQDAYWDGNLTKWRLQFAKSRPDLALDTRAGSDAQVVKVMQQIQNVTGGNPDLMDAIATGRLNTTPLWIVGHDGTPRVSNDFLKRLSAYGDYFPSSTPEQKAIYSADAARRQISDNVFGRAIHTLLSAPSAVLSKSPLFRQAYWERTIQLAPFMTADAQVKVLDVARGEANLGKRLLGDLRDAITSGNQARDPFSGTIDLEQADLLSKSHALDIVRTTTHEFSQRNQGMDMLRLLTPFGEVWRKTIKRWGSIIADNPVVVRRALQGYQALQSPELGKLLGAPTVPGADGTPVQQGFFHPDSFGQEVFTIPGSEWATQALTGVPVPLVGNVKGLSLGTEFFPALGPVASIPVAWTLDKLHLNDVQTPLGPLGETLFPYGPPRAITDVMNYAPTWMKNAIGANRTTSPDSVRTFNNTVVAVIQYGVTNGDYDTSTPEGIQHAFEDASNKARQVYGIRGLANFLVPGAPSPQFLIRDKTGKLVDASVLAQEYKTLQDADPNTAGEKFISMYGPEPFKAITPKSYSYVFGLPTSPDSAKWVDQHPQLRQNYPNVYGYFAPPSDPNQFDYNVYLAQLEPERGRQALTPKQWELVANARSAGLQYGRLRDTIDAATGGKLNDATRALLATYKQQLMDKYPGYQQSLNNWGGTGIEGRPDPALLVGQAIKAADDPTVKSTDAGQGLVSYLAVRDVVDAGWITAGNKAGSWAQAQGSAAIALRQLLRQAADQIVQSHPQFGPLFEDVFQREMRDDTNPADLTSGG